MSSAVSVRRLQSSDADAVVALHCAAFPAETRRYTIYASARVGTYIRSLIAEPEHRADHLFVGAFRSDDLIGYGHFRQLAESWHLNQVAVRPEWQGHAVGESLLRCWLQEGQRRGVSLLTLDVDVSNDRAVGWYQRRGFRLRHLTTLRLKPTEAISSDASLASTVQLSGWERAEATQTRFGFSEFELRRGDGRWTVGRLGERLFRLSNELPEELESVLRCIDARRDLLLVTDERPTPAGFYEVSRLARMEARPAECLARKG